MTEFAHGDVRLAFCDAIRGAGLTPPDKVVADGKLHRFPSNGHRRDDAGWYALYDDEIPAGAFGCWRSGLNETWRADIGREMTQVERDRHRARMEDARREREAEQARRRTEASAQTAALWKAATDARANHPYLSRKGVAPPTTMREIGANEAATILGYAPSCKGEPLTGRLLVAPVKIGERLSTAELIDESGRKSAIYGGAKAGGFWATEHMPYGDGAGRRLLIGEGVATVLTAAAATGCPAVAALSCSNLTAVARAMRERYPGAALVVMADLGNGERDAAEAARAVGGMLAIPDFTGAKPGEHDTDMNDMARLAGIDAVRQAIDTAVQASPPPELETDFGPEPHPWEPGAEEPLPPAITATPFVLRDPAAIPRREWVYGHHLIRKYVSLTVAPGAAGKSSLEIADALAMVTGRDLLGTPIYGGPLRVWLWNLEDPRDELERRIAATAQHYGVTINDIGDRLFVDSGREQGLCLAQQDGSGARILEPVAGALEAAMRARAIDVLVVDPFVSTHNVSENDNGAIDAVAKRWGVIADRTNSAIELVHHLRKLGGVEATAESARGAVSLTAAARSVRVLNRMTPEEAEKAGLDGPKGYFRVGHDKENLAPASNKADWFAMESVVLANGDNVGVVVPWTWPDPFEGITTTDLLSIQKAVDGKGYRASTQAGTWIGRAVAEVLGLDLADRAAKARIAAMIKTWIKNGALVVSTVTGEDRHKHPVVEVGTWATI